MTFHIVVLPSRFAGGLSSLLRGVSAMPLLLAAACLCTTSARAVTIDWARVGNPGNANDPATGSLYGAVNYEYRIAKHEVTIQQYTDFLNAVAATDPYSLYNTTMASNLNIAGISRSGTSGGYTYSVIDNGGPSGSRPITYVSWFDAARFANWMQNGQGSGSTETGAYTISTGQITAASRTGGVNTYTLAAPSTLSVGDQVAVTGLIGTAFNVTGVVASVSGSQFTVANTNSDAVATGTGSMTGASATAAIDAQFYIPTENEWYKAAYYSPLLNSGSGGYYTYAMQSNTAPGNAIGSGANQANYRMANVYSVTQSSIYSSSQNYLTDVGAFSNSASYYGTFDQSGNVWEWNAVITGTVAGSPGALRGLRGGDWTNDALILSPVGRITIDPSMEGSSFFYGFRLAAPVPEPTTYAMALAGVACSGYSMWRRRGNRRRTKSEMNSASNRCQLMCLTLVALSIIAAGVASTTSAAVIVWDTPQTITGDSDVNTSGSLVYAYNVGPSPTVSSTVTVGGVAFQPFPIINFPATNAFTFGSVTISESPGSLFGYDVASTSGSYGLLSPAYRALLDGGGGAGLPDTVTVSLGGLSLGQQYLFQWWASNAADISFVSTVTGLATNSVTLDSNLTNAAGGLGQFATGTFTADGATQNITFTGAANSPLINAFQIRAVPEPTTYAMALAALACGGFSMWRRRKCA